ncbi:MAG: amino acid adenylation domain-containing protein, partial [bacterium]|nr:amino acid adenylation domain-containing protein [bacterium]
SPGGLGHFLVKHKIQVSDGTPTLLSLMMDSLAFRKKTHYNGHYLMHLIIGGEELPSELVNRFYSNRNSINTVITNIYGPTETTVDATGFDCQRDMMGHMDYPVLPIGKPLSNVRIYIVTASDRLAPVGIPGEICIGGAGLARGYLNRPKLTMEKFRELEFQLPDSHVHIQKIYQSGDLGRWLPDGN